jgi:hypothetical protein
MCFDLPRRQVQRGELEPRGHAPGTPGSVIRLTGFRSTTGFRDQKTRQALSRSPRGCRPDKDGEREARGRFRRVQGQVSWVYRETSPTFSNRQTLPKSRCSAMPAGCQSSHLPSLPMALTLVTIPPVMTKTTIKSCAHRRFYQE